jgi:hypothetical protein
MAGFLSMTREIFPPANRQLLTVAAVSTVGFVAFYYGVQLTLSIRSKGQTERQKSWILTSLSRCVSFAYSSVISRLHVVEQRSNDLDQPTVCVALAEDGRCRHSTHIRRPLLRLLCCLSLQVSLTAFISPNR